MKNIDETLLKYIDDIDLDTVELTGDELQRIQNMVLEKSCIERKPKHVKYKWKLISGLLAACFVVIIGFGIVGQKWNTPPDNPQITNPLVSFNTIKEAKANLNDDMMYPHQLPKGYSLEHIWVIDEIILSLEYGMGDDVITFRVTTSDEEISGDYRTYDKEERITYNDTDIVLKSNNGKVYLATWQNFGQSFAISTSAGLSQEEIITIIKNVRNSE